MVLVPTMTAPAARRRSTPRSSYAAMRSPPPPKHTAQRQAGHGDVLLDRDRDAVQRAERLAVGHRPLGPGGLGAGTRGIDVREGAQDRIKLLDPGEEVVGDLDR